VSTAAWAAIAAAVPAAGALLLVIARVRARRTTAGDSGRGRVLPQDPSTREDPVSQPRRNLIRPRQLTIGECAAIARYGPNFIAEPGGKADMWEILRLLDQLQVCEICGWPQEQHRADAVHRFKIRCCPEWTRKL